MGVRKYERSIIKHQCYVDDGNIKSFRYEWAKYHNAKVKARKKKSKNAKKVNNV